MQKLIEVLESSSNNNILPAREKNVDNSKYLAVLFKNI